jgi:hypothetical protein
MFKDRLGPKALAIVRPHLKKVEERRRRRKKI